MAHWGHFPIEEMILAGEAQEDVDLGQRESLDCFFKQISLNRVQAVSELLSLFEGNWDDRDVIESPFAGNTNKNWSMLDSITENSFSPLNS